MRRRILLNRSAASNQNYRWLGGFALRVDAISPDNSADPNIFLFHRTPINPHTQVAENRFLGVCSPVDMSDYPIADPDPQRTYPFFRAASFDIVLRSSRLAEKLWENVKQRVNVLLEALDRLDELTVVETVMLEAGLTSNDSESDSTP